MTHCSIDCWTVKKLFFSYGIGIRRCLFLELGPLTVNLAKRVTDSRPPKSSIMIVKEGVVQGTVVPQSGPLVPTVLWSYIVVTVQCRVP